MDIEKLKDELRMLKGFPPHNKASNICWGDGYFAKSLERKYGKKISELEKISGITEPSEPYDFF